MIATPAMDTKLQRLIGATLRSGVMAASLTGIVGGAIFLAAHGGQPVAFHTFGGANTPYASPVQTVRQALTPMADGNRGLAIAQLGILLLLLTPIIRVAFSVIGFAVENDRLYVAITCVVLATLMISLSLH
ncbi:MAG TPA: DUF1634 domain-containing protein [Granulicella sp.]|jgi:uncharacterized membrane protein|nr:DUF1634 domain-containing protein [Granulicella sp.]